MVRKWLRALRAPFFTASVFPVIFGVAYAHYRAGAFDLLRAALAVVGGVLVHAGLNLANDYFDHVSGNDRLTTATPVSGGSKVIQDGTLTPRAVLAASIVCLASSGAIGLYLNFVLPGNFVLWAGLVGMVLAFFYSAPPLKIGYRGGIGELACTIGFGPVLVLGGYYVQTGAFSWDAVLVSLPTGILVGLILLVNEFHDMEADRAVRKRTLVVLFGRAGAAKIVRASLAATYLLLAGLVVADILPAVALTALVTLPLAVFIARRVTRDHGDARRLLPANFAMIGLHILVTAITTLTVVLQ